MTDTNGPFLVLDRPAPELYLGFTGVDAGNLAYHLADSAPSRERVSHSREQLERAMGVRPGSTEYVTQVHSTRVVGAGGDEVPAEADAIVSASGSEPLAIMVADCLPVVFVSRAVGGHEFSGPTAVAHAGRRGLLDGVLQATVTRMREDGAGSGAGDIAAWIGPGICGRCYEVPEQMRDDGAARVPETFSTTSWGTPALDLAAGAQALLETMGVTVRRVPICTFEDRRLFSHRREPGRGRGVGLVWRTGSGTGPLPATTSTSSASE
ncbi:polyphenol oxidase family protein [Citricoccus sp. GCM10030269]|uniref:polyphenol oxidase family protein n=1 Tax=Citricoccus sp. GCM10030269 TaxID=3273388 RepID=UPI003616BC5E